MLLATDEERSLDERTEVLTSMLHIAEHEIQVKYRLAFMVSLPSVVSHSPNIYFLFSVQGLADRDPQPNDRSE